MIRFDSPETRISIEHRIQRQKHRKRRVVERVHRISVTFSSREMRHNTYTHQQAYEEEEGRRREGGREKDNTGQLLLFL